MEWPGGGRPHSIRLAVVEKYDSLEVERRRLVAEVVGAGFCGLSVEALEADRMILDVEVAVVIVEARNVEALEFLVATVGGRTVELTEADELSRFFDVVEADRMSLDMEVAEVMVEARTLDPFDVDPLQCEGS